MDTEIIKIYSHEDFRHKEYLKNMSIKKFALIHLLLDDGNKSEQVLLSDVPEFNPTAINYSEVNIPSIKYRDNFCKYMDCFHFVEGFFFGREYDNNIKMQRLYLTKRYLETYYFWKEVDFETYQDTLLKSKGPRDNVTDQINKVYKEWVLGSKILLKHCDANSVNAIDIEDFEKFINIINPNTKDKVKTKQYTSIVPNNMNF